MPGINIVTDFQFDVVEQGLCVVAVPVVFAVSVEQVVIQLVGFVTDADITVPEPRGIVLVVFAFVAVRRVVVEPDARTSFNLESSSDSPPSPIADARQP